MEKRLFCVFQDEKKSNDFLIYFKEISNKARSIEKKLENSFYYLKKYFTNSEKESISKLGKIQNNIQNYEVENIINLNFFGVDVSNINLDELNKKSIEIQKIDKSLFFKEIFEKCKKNQDNEEMILNETINKFNGLEDILNGKDSHKISEEEIIAIVKSIKKEDELKTQINLLKKIFFNNEKEEKIGERNLILIHSQEKIKKLISNILKLSDKFEIKKDDLYNQLEKIKNDLEKNIKLNELNLIQEQIDSFNLPILNEEKAKNIIEYLYNKEGIVDFLYNKKVEDIRNLHDFAGEDTESYNVNTFDLQCLETCVYFIQELKIIKTKILIQFLKEFMDLINKQRFEQLEVSLKCTSEKYIELSSLYTDQLDRDSLSKKNIEEIYRLSTFTLKYSNLGYICEVDYEYKNKDKEKRKFEDILDYRDHALMRKKDENNENKEDLFYNICVKFAKIIGSIMKILELLNLIANKGYYEDLC